MNKPKLEFLLAQLEEKRNQGIDYINLGTVMMLIKILLEGGEE